MALTANRDVDHYVDQELRSFQVAATKYVYKGALVSVMSSGYVRPLAAGDGFAGIAFEEIDNSSGANGDESVRVYTQGDFGFTLTGAALADIGRPVFGSADDTLTFTGSGNTYLGIVQDAPASNEIILRIDPTRRLVKTTTHAVDNLAAGADVAARAIHVFDMDGWVVAARVVNQATAAAGIDNSNTCVVTVAADAGTIASETFNATTTFPSANAPHDMGAITNPHVGGKSVLTVAVTNGATADPGPFVVEIDFV